MSKKIPQILSLLLILAPISQAQEGTLSIQDYVKDYLASRTTFIQALKAREFPKALDTANHMIDIFYQQPKEQQGWNPYHKIEGLYNRACAYAQLNRLDDAWADLDKAYSLGFEDWGAISEEAYLNPMRDQTRFKDLLAKVREKGDKIYILQKSGQYLDEPTSGEFVYQAPSAPELKALRKDWRLDEIAGRGDEASKIINLMVWVHKRVRHDGANTGNVRRDARTLVEYCDTSKRGVNCRMLATILNEVYLAMGFKSRHVTCMPKSSIDTDCHVINAVWSKSLKKWVYMDPTNEGYFRDEAGKLMSIAEVREGLRSGRTMKVNPNLNWNGEPYTESSYRQYMAKNLYWLITPLTSKVGFESEKKDYRYMTLVPVGFNPYNVNSGVVTSNEKAFWAKPN